MIRIPLCKPFNANKSTSLPAYEFLQWVEHGIEEALDIAVAVLNGVWTVVCQIGDAFYHALLDTFAAVG